MQNVTVRLTDMPDPARSIASMLEKIIWSQIDVLRKKSEHPLSQPLTENPAIHDQKKYDLLPISDYEHTTPIQAKRYDAIGPNIGWKLHLNVAPQNVVEVSKYLISNGFRHKYFHGGELDNGKVFTIYIGSRQLAEEQSQILSRDLGHLLARPVDHREIEFTSGVVGRFTSIDQGDFHQYGFSGMVMPTEAFKGIMAQIRKHWNNFRLSPRQRRDVEYRSFFALKQMYGTYFTG
jgi:hypothetical protein